MAEPNFTRKPATTLPPLAQVFVGTVYQRPNIDMVIKLRGEIGDGLAGNVRHVADSVYEISTIDPDDGTQAITCFDACDLIWFEFYVQKRPAGALTLEEIEELDKQPTKAANLRRVEDAATEASKEGDDHT